MFKSFLLIFLLTLFGCSIKTEPASAPVEGVFKHIVLLDLKNTCTEADKQKVVERLYELSEIEGVIGLEVSSRYETMDSRAIQDYDLMLYMEFDSEEMLYAYASDVNHLQVKGDILPYLGASPLVIDTKE